MFYYSEPIMLTNKHINKDILSKRSISLHYIGRESVSVTNLRNWKKSHHWLSDDFFSSYGGWFRYCKISRVDVPL